VIVPLDLEAVIAGLRDKAKQGNAPAAAQLLAYLTRFPPVLDHAIQAGKPIEDMTPDQLAFAEAYATRRINRAMRRMAALQAGGKD
jgi:hypothetical protein